MKLLEQLENPNFKLSKSDKKFMDYIKKNIANISHTAIAKLADESGIGEATITRFVKKMGFSSLQEFKLTLAGELKEKCNQFSILFLSKLRPKHSQNLNGYQMHKVLLSNYFTLNYIYKMEE